MLFEMVSSNKLVTDQVINFTVETTVDLLRVALISKGFFDIVFGKDKDCGIMQCYRHFNVQHDCGITAARLRLALIRQFGLTDVLGFYQFLYEHDATIAGSLPLLCLKSWKDEDDFSKNCNDIDVYVPYRLKDSNFEYLFQAGFEMVYSRPVTAEALGEQDFKEGDPSLEDYMTDPIAGLNVYSVKTFVKGSSADGLPYDVRIQMIIMRDNTTVEECVSSFDLTICMTKISIIMLQTDGHAKYGICVSLPFGSMEDIVAHRLRLSKRFHLAMQTLYNMCFCVTVAEEAFSLDSVYTFKRTSVLTLSRARHRIAKYVERGYGFDGCLPFPRAWKVMNDQPFPSYWSDGNSELHYLCNMKCTTDAQFDEVFVRAKKYIESQASRSDDAWKGRGAVGDTALHLAAYRGHYQVVEYLLYVHPQAAGQMNDAMRFPFECLMGPRQRILTICNGEPLTKRMFGTCMEHALVHDKLWIALRVEKKNYEEDLPRDLSGNGIAVLRMPVVGPVPTVRRIVCDFYGSPEGLW